MAKGARPLREWRVPLKRWGAKRTAGCLPGAPCAHRVTRRRGRRSTGRPCSSTCWLQSGRCASRAAPPLSRALHDGPHGVSQGLRSSWGSWGSWGASAALQGEQARALGRQGGRAARRACCGHRGPAPSSDGAALQEGVGARLRRHVGPAAALRRREVDIRQLGRR